MFQNNLLLVSVCVPPPQPTASQPLSNPQNLGTFVQASFPCISLTTNRIAPVSAPWQLTPGQVCLFSFQICVVWSPCAPGRAWCGSLTGLFFRGAQAAAAWDSPGPGGCRSGWVVEYRRRDRVLSGAQGLTPTWASFFALQLLPNFPLTGQTSSPFASASARNSSLARPVCSCPALGRLSHLPSLSALALFQPEPLQTNAPLHAASHKQ